MDTHSFRKNVVSAYFMPGWRYDTGLLIMTLHVWAHKASSLAGVIDNTVEIVLLGCGYTSSRWQEGSMGGEAGKVAEARPHGPP